MWRWCGLQRTQASRMNHCKFLIKKKKTQLKISFMQASLTLRFRNQGAEKFAKEGHIWRNLKKSLAGHSIRMHLFLKCRFQRKWPLKWCTASVSECECLYSSMHACLMYKSLRVYLFEYALAVPALPYKDTCLWLPACLGPSCGV